MAILQQLISNSVIEHLNFFNGRLLTGRDLQDEQLANREQRALLGKGVGSGVVEGLTVEAHATELQLKVTKGCAVNREGTVLALQEDIEITLTATGAEEDSESGDCANEGDFSDCNPAVSATLESGTESGLFLFVIGPASAFSSETAPKHESFDTGTITGCGQKNVEHGVQFRLVALPGNDQITFDAAVDDTEALSHYRNEIAHWLSDTSRLTPSVGEPFGGPPEDRPEALESSDLQDCEVPLAVLWWESSEIRFLDMWAVRRRLAKAVSDLTWPLYTQGWRLAAAEAVFLQFQDQLEWLKTEADSPGSLDASRYFRYLPPAGFLPTGNGEFAAGEFFGQFNPSESALDPAFTRHLLRGSFFVEPIDLDAESLPGLRLHRPSDESAGYVIFTRETNIETGGVRITLEPLIGGAKEVRSDRRAAANVSEMAVDHVLTDVGDLAGFPDFEIALPDPSQPSITFSVVSNKGSTKTITTTKLEVVVDDLPVEEVWSVLVELQGFVAIPSPAVVPLKPGETSQVRVLIIPEKNLQ